MLLLLILIVITTAGLTLMIAHGVMPDLIVLTSLLLIAEVWFTLRHSRKATKQILHFFHMLENEDTLSRYNAETSNSTQRQLSAAMNRVTSNIERLKIEAAENELKLKAVIEHSVSGLLAVDSNNFIVVANSSAKQLIGASVLTHTSQISRANAELHNLMQNLANGGVATLATHNPPRVLSIRLATLVIANSPLRLYSIVDIKPELDAREVDSWSKLTRVITHEIMNGIAPILSVSQKLSTTVSSGQNTLTDRQSATLHQGLQVVREQSESLMRFVEHYRQFARIPMPQKSEVNVAQLFAKVEMLAQQMLQQKGIAISTQAHSHSTITADENQMVQILLNLVQNAAEALDNTPNPTIALHHASTPEGATITITDNGTGIPPEQLQEIFVPFYTTKPNGSGIGLSIVRQIVHLHGGSINVRSNLGEGSCFEVRV